MINKDYLERKGWTAQETEHAKKVQQHASTLKKQHHYLLDETSYWVILIIAMFSTIAIATWVIPLLVLANTVTLYLILGIIGLGFGGLYNHTLKDLEHLNKHHHILYILIVPISSTISFLTMVRQTNALGVATHNGLIAGIVFGLLLLAPYLYHVIRQ